MKTRSRILIVVLGVVIIVILGLQSKPEKTEVVRIGVIAPLTGPAASIGDWMVQGVDLAVSEINTAVGLNGKKVEVVIEDDQCTGKEGVSAYQKLRAQDINYFVGPLCSASRVPVLSAAENDKTILVTTGLALITAPETRAYTFNVLPSIWSVAQSIADFANQKGVKTVSLLYVDDEYGKENNLAVVDYARSKNITLVSVEKYNRGTTDLRTQILKLKNDSSGAVLMAGYGPDYAVFLKQAKELGLNKLILATSNIQVPEVLESSKSFGRPVYYSYPSVSNLKTVVDFANNFKKLKPDAPTFLPMYIGSGYDAAMLLGEAIASCENSNSDCVKNYLTKVKNYEGSNGLISFDQTGNNVAGSAIEIRILEKGVFKRLLK